MKSSSSKYHLDSSKSETATKNSLLFNILKHDILGHRAKVKINKRVKNDSTKRTTT